MATFREMRESLGLAPAEMAAKLQVSVGTLGNWESGRTIPIGSMDTLLRYCSAYGCSPEVLVEAQKETGYLR